MKTMKRVGSIATTVASALTCAVLFAVPVAGAADGSDAGFNQSVGTMAGRDTGSLWFEYYVAALNQEIAFKDGQEAYGAAGPNGPLDGFTGYVGSFIGPDTGSIWFNDYVDAVNRQLRELQQ